MRISWFASASQPLLPSPLRRRNDGWGRLCTPHPHPVHCGEGMTDRGLCCLGLTALCPLDERRDIAACYRKAPDCQVFFEHQRWFIRSSLTEIPSRPFRTIHCGEGMTDGGLCPPDSAPLCHLDVKRDIAACYGKAPDCQVFFEHQRRFIRSSLTEIPSWPFRTIHCGEGMTDRGLCPPHPHLVHCGEGMTDGGGFVLPIPPAVVLWTKGEISMLATEKHPTARFFRTSKALHPVIAARDSFSAIPHDPPRRRNDGWGSQPFVDSAENPHPVRTAAKAMTDGGWGALSCILRRSHLPLSSGRKERYRCLLQKSTRLPGFFRTSKVVHPVIADRDSFSAIPHDPLRRRNDGWGALSSRFRPPLSSGRKERYRCLLRKSTRLPGFFELQRHFIRSSLTEIPSWPFRTIHRGEGMTDRGLCPPHPHLVHCGEGMTDGGGFVLPIPPAVVLWTKGEISLLATEKHPTARFFRTSKALHPVIAARDSFSAIPHDPPRRRNDGWGALLPGSHRPLSSGRKERLSLLATEKHPTARFFRTSKALHPVIAARDSFSAIPHDPPRRRNDGWGALLPGSHRPLSSGRKERLSLLATEKHPTARFFRTSKALHPVIAGGDSFSAIPHDPPRRRNDEWRALLPGSHRPLSSGRKERLSLLATEKHPTARFFRTSKALHPVIAARDSFSAIPHDPPRRRNDGWGALSSASPPGSPRRRNDR
jgi:hypothetical protein